MSILEIEGFDPLIENGTPGGLEPSIADEAIRREVLNILKSYTGYFDIFSELLQNSLDAVDTRLKLDSTNYVPKIFVDIDIASNKVRVTDNGCGMNPDQFKFCFRPNVSFKQRREGRGHKGVGATFVAYGFSNVRLYTKKPNQEIAGQLSNGRRWCEDYSGSYPRPTFSSINYCPSELVSEASGTSVEVTIEESQRPKLAWIQATNADQWVDLLRIKTPIGGIYLTAVRRERNVEFHVTVTDISGNKTSKKSNNIDYYYPHEIPLVNKAKSIKEIEEKFQSISGDPSTKLNRLPDDFRRLDAIWEVWTAQEILSEVIFTRNLDEEQKILIQRHNIAIYGCFVSSAKTWTSFQKDCLKVRPTAVLLRGGMQLASDCMPQGDLSVIPLTTTIGYQNNTHLVIHLTDGNPDMGRKVFQPEVKTLSDELSRRAVDIFKQYLSLMREDTGAPTISSARDLRDFKIRQERHREDLPFALRVNEIQMSILSEPQSEQDVIALFHELIGARKLVGYGFLATSENERYDSIFVTNYNFDNAIYSPNNPLGVSQGIDRRESIPFVLEYKYDADALIDDFSKQKKFIADIDLLVCWDMGRKTSLEFSVSSFLVGDEGSVREYFGSTHAFYQSREKRMEVVCLKDLVNYIMDADSEIARQRQLYG